MLYRILRAIISFGIRHYYREIRVINKHLLEKEEGPLIIIANHPNTLMDAWMVGFANRRRVHFMAKATFFNSPFKRKLLGALGMIPINRKSDGAVSGVSNKDSFAACYELLERGEILVVFPEGTSFLERKLREIKTGTARIALEVERRNQGKLGLKVVPIGLNYISADSYRGKVLVHVGKSIEIDDLWKEYEINPGNAAKLLTERFRVELSRVFVTLDDSAREDLVEQLSTLFVTKYTNRTQVSDEMNFMKSVQNRLEEYSLTAPWKVDDIQTETTKLAASLQFLGIKPDFLDRPYRPGLFIRQFIQSWLFVISTVPIFLVGFVHHVLPYWFIGWIVPKLSKEVEYHAPLSILLGLVLYPLNYAGFGLIVHFCFDFSWLQTLLYLAVLPLFGTFAHFFMRYMKHLNSKQRFGRFAHRRSAILQNLKEQREQLKDLIFRD
ncbi:lysophospholipid acyltransferase family protein [Fluviicola taffensis]|uniref:Phospholipid/glycerol acyltransferase n=1 Tax=Fluviicola taffensis (strain DSM 16823 / NCIMB 13979 / RW262) TaxID=755732 RepID=F2IE99_FLUTR|nr:lysophospholipid acyltransferase family protein [Fluviicola taffensis]AEA42417.1 phospholipid/glycerol acyltransferase [Fluviicola taffensis DSM 16823]